MMFYVVLIVILLASLPFVIWLVDTLRHNKHLPWEARILDDPLYSRPVEIADWKIPDQTIIQLKLKKREDPEKRKGTAKKT